MSGRRLFRIIARKIDTYGASQSILNKGIKNFENDINSLIKEGYT